MGIQWEVVLLHNYVNCKHQVTKKERSSLMEDCIDSWYVVGCIYRPPKSDLAPFLAASMIFYKW